MGITGLWEILGDGEVCHIADYASSFFLQHKRPLRIAVDAACWRFTNLTPEQVRKIQEKEPAANPVEKVILWRVLRLLKLNIQLIFVNDGMRRPRKRNKRGGNKLDYEIIRLENQLLDNLKVAHHLAPGEAEAECAKLNALGVVDAVWSDDGDALMFGANTMIRQHKSNGTIVKDHIRVYRADTILSKHDLDADSLVLFAVLAGGDYATEGLRGCGPKLAAALCKCQLGLARALCHSSQHDLQGWRTNLQQALLTSSTNQYCEVPWTFPDYKALRNYCDPTVSTPEQLNNLRGLKHGWDRPMDQRKLRIILRERFNFSTREWMKHIMPIYLTRALARATPAQRSENLALGVQLKRTRAKKIDDTPPKPEVKITFSPLSISEVDLSAPPLGENWSQFAGKDGTPYDPMADLECEIPRCFLDHGLPEGAFEETPPAVKKPKKRKERDGEEEEVTPPKKSRRRTSEGLQKDAQDRSGIDNSKKTQSKPMGRRKNSAGGDSQSTPASSGPDVESSNTRPSPQVFKVPRELPMLKQRLNVIEMCDSDSEGDVVVLKGTAKGVGGVSLPGTGDCRPQVAMPVPGETISPDALRQLRAASTLLRSVRSNASEMRQSMGFARYKEVIDLT